MKKGLKITLSIIGALVFSVSLFLVIWFCGKTHKDFYAYASQEFAIPGLEDNFTPQGLTYNEANNVYVASGYLSDGGASRVYVIDGEDVKYFTLKVDGSDYVGHCGGIATYGNFGYIVGEKTIYIFNFTEALALENGKSINCLETIDAPNGADFIHIDDNGILYLGEFYHEKKYPTAEKHHITLQDGLVNPAITYAYRTNNNPASYNFDFANPNFAISTTEKIQGMAISQDGNIILSKSWSLSDSSILVYDSLNNIGSTETFDYNGSQIPLYILDSSNLIKEVVAPSMSEEIVVVNNKLYVLFENACAKYKTFTRHKNENVVSISVTDLLK